MEFRLLGPLEIRDGGRTLVLGAPRQRVLLGQLLLHASRPVPVDDLVEVLWGPHLPSRPRTAVQLLVLRLRRALADHGCTARIESTPGAYCLELHQDRCDARHFEHLVGRADTARDRGDRATEARLLDEALALWRGPVLGIADGEWDERSPAARLVQARVTTAERLAAAELAAGHEERAIAVARRFVAEYPGRERLRLLLMRALYRSGRRAEALAAYDDAYRYAVDELGLEPGDELRALQHDILRGQDEATVRGQPKPAALPMRLTGFLGREALAAGLCRSLVVGAERGAAVHGVSGMAGVGKSALALHVAHELREHFPDGQLYADLGAGRQAPVPAAEVLLRFLRLLGLDDTGVPASEEARAELFRARTGGRRMLIVLDDAASAAQVRPLLPGSAGSAVLVTSRSALTGVDGARWTALDVLDDDESAAVLANLAGAERVLAAPEATARVVRYCGRLPLALRVVGARLAARPSWSMERVADQLADERRRLDRLTADDLAVRSSIELSHRLCSAEQQRALRLVSLLDVPWFSAWAVAALLDADLDTGTEVVEQLVDAQLVQAVRAGDPDGYRLHDLVRLYAREQAADEDTGAAVLRFAATARTLTERAMGTFLMYRHWFLGSPPVEYRTRVAWRPDGPKAARAWLEAERPVLIAAATQAAAHGHAAEATGLAA
ncbi:MAG TPA: BTAD domain-containing putative transcriptional regulator, partial [Pseudonocardiaceae bacterium]